jgi:DNA repair protein SbcC/Rad50
LEEAKQSQAEAKGRLEEINNEVLALESQGLSVERVEQVSDRLRKLGHPLGEFSRRALDQLLLSLDQNLTESSRALEAKREQAEELQMALEAALGSAETNVQGFRRALSQLKERLAMAERLQAKLSNFLSFPWPGGKPLAELAVEAESVRAMAADLQASHGREKQAQTTYAESINRKELLERRLEKLNPQIARLTKAQGTLRTLMREHSLTDAMKSALEKNRAGIELIFSRIHSPAEFRGLGSSWTTLVRKVDGMEARLSEISTGQRAAFALSIFLAQNAQLTDAPPVVLIDDPVAHIDDLNSLSFLDYLREVVLKGQRQIFFSTANEKLATLFERKFDFLNTEFRRFNLSRT